MYRMYIIINSEAIYSSEIEVRNLHLVSIGKTINLFSVTGHINYAKSFGCYLRLCISYQLIILDYLIASLNKDFVLLTEVTDTGQDYGQT